MRTANLARRVARDMVPRGVKLTLGTGVLVSAVLGSVALTALVRHLEPRDSGGGTGGIARATEAPSRIRGLVLNADGQPVEGVEVMLARTSAPVALYGREPEGVLSITTGADGTFDFPAEPDATSLVARCETGCAQVLVSDLPAGGAITLNPWGRIRGTVKLDGKPAAGQVVELLRADGSIPEWIAWRIMHETRTRTNALGYFVFPRVAGSRRDVPVKLSVRCGNRLRVVRVAPGETVGVDLGGSGAVIVGRVTPVDPNLPQLTGSISRQEPPAPVALATWSPATPASRPAAPASATVARAPTHAVVASAASTRSVASAAKPPELFASPPTFAIQPDGMFRVEDVPPGDYVLSFHGTATAAGTSIADDLAWGQAFVTVPETLGAADAPINVGLVRVHANTLLWPGQTVPDFTVKGAGGNTVRLADYRDKYLLLYVQPAGWDTSPLAPESLEAVYDRFRDDPRFAMLEVATGGSPGGTGKSQHAPSTPWPVASDAVAKRGNFLGFSIGGTPLSTFPAIYLFSPTRLYLIDPQGKCAGRSLDAKSALTLLSKLQESGLLRSRP